MAVREAEIEEYLFGRVKKLKGECIKLVQGTGLPDRVVVLPNGRIFFIELKKQGTGRLSALQRERIKRLRKLGATVYIPDTKTEIDEILRKETDNG